MLKRSEIQNKFNTWIGSRNDMGKDYLKPINVEKKTKYGKWPRTHEIYNGCFLYLRETRVLEIHKLKENPHVLFLPSLNT